MKALILEDNLSLGRALQQLLSAEGWESQCCGSWAEASLKINKEAFDIVILDILLPDKKGFEALEALTNSSIKKAFVISGFFDKSSLTDKIPKSFQGRWEFFKKPIDEKQLRKSLREFKTKESSQKPEGLYFFTEKGLIKNPLFSYLPENKTFDSKELIAAVFTAYYKKFTGGFHITTDNGSKALIKFYEGQITKAAAGGQKSFFGALLVEYGLGLAEDIQPLLENGESNKPIGEKLVEKELLSPYMLSLILKEQIKIRLSEVMSSPSFRLKIVESDEQDIKDPEVNFNEIDLIEWAADSLQTERAEDFLNSFFLNAQALPIEKASQINKILINQKAFLKEYNLLFRNLKEGEASNQLFQNSKEDQNRQKQLLYFGLLTKSITLKGEAYKKSQIKNQNFIVESILEKDEKDLFSILNLPWNASAAEAEKSYRQLALAIHPDSLPDQASEEIRAKYEKAFDKLTKSCAVLKNEQKRQRYMQIQKEEALVSIMNKYEEGLTQIKQEKYKEGIDTLESIRNHKQAPSNIMLYILWARLKRLPPGSLLKNRAAAAQIKKSIDSCPVSLRASSLFWYVKGLFCLETKQYEQAESLFNKSLKVEKGFKEALKELLFLKQLQRNHPGRKLKRFAGFLFKKSS